MKLPNNNPHNKPYSLTLYVLHLPILLLLLAVFSISAFVSSRVASEAVGENFGNENDLSLVLGDDDDEDASDDADSNDSEDDEDEDEDSDDTSGSDDEDDENDDEDEDDSDDLNDDDIDEVDDDDEFDDEEEDEEEDESKERVQNSDGTFSIIEREEENGEIKFEIKTYDANGNKIRVEKYEGDDEGEESELKIYNEQGVQIGDFKLKTENGKELELRFRSGETELSRVSFDVDSQELIVESDDNEEGENKLRIRSEGDNFMLTRKGVNVLTRFPLVVDDASGIVYVQTPVGEIQLGVMPDSIVEKAESSDDIDEVDEIALESEDDSMAPLEFKLTGTKAEKLLGVFNLQLPSILVYDAQTGGFLRSEQSFVTKILDLFSI